MIFVENTSHFTLLRVVLRVVVVHDATALNPSFLSVVKKWVVKKWVENSVDERASLRDILAMQKGNKKEIN